MKSFARILVAITICSLALSASAASIPPPPGGYAARTPRFVEFYSPL